MNRETHIHPFDPVCDALCRVLVLGTFPSVKSRENAFYYGHPQNRFWRVVSAVFEEPLPQSIPQKRAMLLRHHIALWDVIASCDIAGSSDASIRNAVPNDLPALLRESRIDCILLNGKTAERIYLKYWKDLSVPHLCLPSTSPANAACGLDALITAWRKALTGEDTAL